MVISSWTFKIRARGLCYPVVKWWCVNPASRSNLSLNCCCWITISLLHLLRARSRWHPNLLHLRRGPVGANAGGSGHAGEARGDAGWVSRSAVPHGWSPDGRNKSRVWRSESHKPRPVALCVLVLISNGMTHGARWDTKKVNSCSTLLWCVSGRRMVDQHAAWLSSIAIWTLQH